MKTRDLPRKYLLLLLVYNGHEALSNELTLNLTCLRGSYLAHHLLTGDLSSLLEFTHVFTVTLALLLLCVGTASLKGGGGNTLHSESGNWSESL